MEATMPFASGQSTSRTAVRVMSSFRPCQAGLRKLWGDPISVCGSKPRYGINTENLVRELAVLAKSALGPNV